MLFEVGQLSLDVCQRVQDLVERGRVHLLNGPETRQFLPEAHYLTDSLLGQLRVEAHEVHAREALVLRRCQGALAVARSFVLIRRLQTGPFEEVLLRVVGSLLRSSRATTGDLVSGYGHNLSSVGLGRSLELKEMLLVE